jgi:hypothetical protein
VQQPIDAVRFRIDAQIERALEELTAKALHPSGALLRSLRERRSRDRTHQNATFQPRIGLCHPFPHPLLFETSLDEFQRSRTRRAVETPGYQ